MRTFTFTDTELKMILEGLEMVASESTSREKGRPYLDLSARLRFYPEAKTTSTAEGPYEDIDAMSDAVGWKKPRT